MPRPSLSTYEEFAAAARTIVAEGKVVTIATVRIKLGGGSYDVLKRYLSQWQSKQISPSETGMPSLKVMQDIEAWYIKLVEVATVEAEKRMAAAKELLDERERSLKIREEELDRQQAIAGGREEILRAQITTLEQRLDTAQKQILAKEIELARMSDKLLS